jgi:response regulator NasT
VESLAVITSESDSTDATRIIFVVDDESLVAMGLKSMLEKLGFAAVHTFARAEDALARLNAMKPDLVLMDIKLGEGMDGLAAAREVMERRPCPVIMTTAYTEETYLQEAMQSHVFGYLVKPVSSRQLASAIAVARSRFREFQRLQTENSTLRDALETRKLVERAKGILMARRQLTESQAYEMMRTQSQQKSCAMRDIAQSIINAAEFL